MAHGWNQELFMINEDDTSENIHRESPVARADKIVNKLNQVRE